MKDLHPPFPQHCTEAPSDDDQPCLPGSCLPPSSPDETASGHMSFGRESGRAQFVSCAFCQRLQVLLSHIEDRREAARGVGPQLCSGRRYTGNCAYNSHRCVIRPSTARDLGHRNIRTLRIVYRQNYTHRVTRPQPTEPDYWRSSVKVLLEFREVMMSPPRQAEGLHSMRYRRGRPQGISAGVALFLPTPGMDIPHFRRTARNLGGF